MDKYYIKLVRLIIACLACVVIVFSTTLIGYAADNITFDINPQATVKLDPFSGIVTEHGSLIIDKNISLHTANNKEGIVDIGTYPEFPTGVEFPFDGYKPSLPLFSNHVYLIRLPFLIANKAEDYDYAILQLTTQNEVIYRFVSSKELDDSSYYCVQHEAGFRDVNKSRLIAHSALDSLPADGITETKINARITDGFGVPLQNQMVQFEQIKGSGTLIVEQAATDDDGNAVAKYISGRVAKTTQIRISDPKSGNHAELDIALAISSHLTVNLISPTDYISRPTSVGLEIPFILSLNVFPNKIPADGMTTCKLTATLLHKENLQPVVGMPLVFSIINGGGELTNINSSTDLMGQAISYYRGSVRPGNVKVAVREPISGLTTETDITVVEAGPASIKLTFIDSKGKELEGGTTLPADGVTSVTIKAVVLDLANLPVPNVVVNFTLMDGNGRLDKTQLSSGADGCATNSYYCGNIVGEETITAFVSSKLYDSPLKSNDK